MNSEIRCYAQCVSLLFTSLNGVLLSAKPMKERHQISDFRATFFNFPQNSMTSEIFQKKIVVSLFRIQDPFIKPKNKFTLEKVGSNYDSS